MVKADYRHLIIKCVFFYFPCRFLKILRSVNLYSTTSFALNYVYESIRNSFGGINIDITNLGCKLIVSVSGWRISALLSRTRLDLVKEMTIHDPLVIWLYKGIQEITLHSIVVFKGATL